MINPPDPGVSGSKKGTESMGLRRHTLCQHTWCTGDEVCLGHMAPEFGHFYAGGVDDESADLLRTGVVIFVAEEVQRVEDMTRQDEFYGGRFGGSVSKAGMGCHDGYHYPCMGAIATHDRG